MTISPEDKLRAVRPEVPLPSETRHRILGLLANEADQQSPRKGVSRSLVGAAVVCAAAIAVVAGLAWSDERSSPTTIATDGPTSSIPTEDSPTTELQSLLDLLPVPASFDESLVPVLAEPTAQIAAATSAVTCAWIEQWVAAVNANDELSAREARDALQSTATWPPLLEIAPTSGHPEVVWGYADLVVDATTDPLPTAAPDALNGFRDALACPT